MEQEKRPIRYEHYCIVVISTVILASMLLCWNMLLPFSAFLFVVAISEILLMPRYLKVSYSCRRPSSLVQDWLLLFCALGSFIFERPEFPNHLFYVGIMAFAFADLSVWINDKWKHSIVVSPFSFLHIVPLLFAVLISAIAIVLTIQVNISTLSVIYCIFNAFSIALFIPLIIYYKDVLSVIRNQLVLNPNTDIIISSFLLYELLSGPYQINVCIFKGLLILFFLTDFMIQKYLNKSGH